MAIQIKLCRKTENHLCKDTAGISYKSANELIYGGSESSFFNVMSKIDTFNRDEFFAVFPKSGVVLIDDLDEIHPSSATLLLGSISDYLNEVNAGIRVVIFSRPEALHGYFTSAKRDKQLVNPRIFPLHTPGYLTEAEILLIVKDWSKFAIPNRTDNEANRISTAIYRYSCIRPWMQQTLKNLTLANFLVSVHAPLRSRGFAGRVAVA